MDDRLGLMNSRVEMNLGTSLKREKTGGTIENLMGRRRYGKGHQTDHQRTRRTQADMSYITENGLGRDQDITL